MFAHQPCLCIDGHDAHCYATLFCGSMAMSLGLNQAQVGWLALSQPGWTGLPLVTQSDPWKGVFCYPRPCSNAN